MFQASIAAALEKSNSLLRDRPIKVVNKRTNLPIWQVCLMALSMQSEFEACCHCYKNYAQIAHRTQVMHRVIFCMCRCFPREDEAARVEGGGDLHRLFGAVVAGVPVATGEATTILTTEH
jgi:hypothetical protein